MTDQKIIMELLTLKEFEKQWRRLLERDDHIYRCLESREGQSSATTMTTTSIRDDDDVVHEDRYDCRSLAIPPTHELVDSVADDFVQQWRELDQRKISSDNVILAQKQTNRHSSTADDTDTTMTDNHDENVPKPMPRWYEKHIRLPEQFDYASLREKPPVDDDGFSGDRVIDLLDPSTTRSYDTALWELFNNIPRASELAHRVIAGYALPNTEKLFQEIISGYQSYLQLDGHALSRLRMNDRHDLPMIMARRGHSQVSSLLSLITTIRFECWRCQLKRGSTPDPNRMVVELRGSDTLLDFHRTIVELSDDELWQQQGKNCPAAGDDTSEETTQKELKSSSGYFFIEGVFYVTGTTDHTTPIVEWIKMGSERERQNRFAHLGLRDEHFVGKNRLPIIQNMADIRLEDMPCRLGFRYVHVHNGDVECAVFVTDRRFFPGDETEVQFPILHDVWTPTNTIPDCEACQVRSAAVVTSTSCQISGGHRALCESCCRALGISDHRHIQRFSVWQGQADLSAGASAETTF
jgi:hypothetical protein